MDEILEFAIIGTTASGKTNLAHQIAKDLNAIILSLDSLCVYKGLDIISAKPSKEQTNEILYFGIDVVELNEHFSVGLFIDLYHQAKATAKAQNRPLIITGGTGFYLKTMLEGLSADVAPSTQEINYKALYEQIISQDKDYKVLPNDKYRLHKYQSILEHITKHNLKNASGAMLKPSEFWRASKSAPIISGIDVFDIVLDKDYLREKISLRTNTMLNSGAIDECVRLKNIYGKCRALECIGAKECLEYHDGLYGYDELVWRINTHTAQLAKRQRTFNKKFALISRYKALNAADKAQIYAALNINA